MNSKYNNGDRLDAVTEKEWREALDELTAYLTWRLRGKTSKGAHSERVLGMPAFDYYQEEAVVKLIEGDWKWQERFTLGKQLAQIATNLITKQVERYQRAHPWVKDPEFEIDEDDSATSSETSEGDADEPTEELRNEGFKRKPQFIEVRDLEQLPDVEDDDGQEELDETYEQVFALVADDEELTLYVEAIVHCNKFKELPEYLGIPIKKVYRLQEKLMRRIRRWQERSAREK